MTKKALLFLAFSVAGFAQYDRPVRYWTTDPTGACNVITPLWNNWVAGKVWQCVGPTTTPGAGSWQVISGGGGSSAFSALTTGSNTTAVMTVGSGANLTFTGTGIINASKILGTTITGLTGPIKFTSGIPSVAVAADIIGLFSACSGSQYLGADGSCHNAAGAGTVTSVGLSAPAWLTVGGSPVTTAGTLALTATTGQTSHQVIGTCGAGTTFAPCALVLGDLPTIAGGTNGQVQVNNAGVFGGFTVGGDGTLNTGTGALAVTKTGGVSFATSATTDTTNATNIISGTLAVARMATGYAYSNLSGAPTIVYQLVGNNGTSQTARNRLNFVPGTNVTFSFADNGGTNSTDVTINATAGGTGNAAQLHTVTFSSTPAFACTSGSAGTVETFELSTTLTANITPTISGCTSGQTVNIRLKQDATGGRTVTWPAAWNTLAQPSPLANIETTYVAVWDGTSGKGSAASDGQGTCPEQAAPGVSPPAGSEFPWCDSTGLFPRWRNSSGTIFQASKELTAGNVRVAGGANAVDTALSLTTTGTSGASTLSGGTLNIPQYASGVLSGTLAAIPATCTVGVSIYQATDQPITLQMYACTATNTWTRQDYTQGTTASKPATCSLGQTYFSTDATAGQNWFFCTATNTWTQQLNSGLASGHSVAAVLTCPTSSASGTAEVCNTSPTFTPAAGDTIIFQADIANTGAFTLNVNSLGVKSVKKNGTAALIANDILASPFQVVMTYDGTNWEMQGQAGNAAAGGGTNMCSDMFTTPGAITFNVTAGHVNCITVSGTYTITAAVSFVNANVSVVCLTPGVIIKQNTAATDIFDTAADNLTFKGCTLDKNSATGGAIFHHTAGNRLHLQDLIIQNAGTNSGNGAIVISAGDHNVIERNDGLSISDGFIFVDGASADATYGVIRDNRVTGSTPTINITSTTNAARNWSTVTNKVESTGSACFKTGGSNNLIVENQWEENDCRATGTMSVAGYVMNGLIKTRFANNHYNGNTQVNSGGMSLSDCTGGTITGNTVLDAWEFSIQEIDSGACSTTGNYVEVAQASSIGDTTYGINIFESGLGNVGNTITGNTIVWRPSTNYQGATAALSVHSATAHATGNCSLTGNNIFDAGAALAANATLHGIEIGSATGTTNNCSISGGNIGMPAVGIGTSSTAIVIGSAATGTLIGQLNLVLGTGATYFTDSGVNTHMVPQCHDYNLTASSTNWLVTIDGSGTTTTAQSAATTQNVVLFALCPHCLITAIDVKTSTAFTATGLTSMTTTVGDSAGGTTFYTSSTYDLHAAVSNTNFQDSVLAKRATQAGSNVTAALTANQNFTANTITGSADYRVCWVAP